MKKTEFIDPVDMGDISIEEINGRIFRLCPDAIIGVNNEGIITIFNRAAQNLTGWKADEVIGKQHIAEVYGSKDIARHVKKNLYSESFGGRGRLEGFEVVGFSKAGREIPVRLSAIILEKDGKEIGSVGFFHDMSARKQLEEDLLRLSITDSLTGLYNRRHLYSVLRDEVSRAERYHRPLTMIYFDLDNFKPFNDSFGHREGDNILCHVAGHTNEMLRFHDSAFRHGGDEFAVLLVETSLDNGHNAAERFRKSFNDKWPDFMGHLETGLKPVTLSLGVAQHKPGEKAEQILMRADLAMYEAKNLGGDCTVNAGAHIGQTEEDNQD